MKVKDLIEKLQAIDPELMVVRSGYEGGVTEATEVDVQIAALYIHKEWYYGEHELLVVDGDYPNKEHATVVHIH